MKPVKFSMRGWVERGSDALEDQLRASNLWGEIITMVHNELWVLKCGSDIIKQEAITTFSVDNNKVP